VSSRGDIAVGASGVGKEYRIGQLQGGYQLLSEVVAQRLRRGRAPREDSSRFWALRDVDFEVRRGESFGIIGHNGAGKSTLLKILSRVTPPTTGEIVLDGRVGALLEVGTGFHAELTGRENVFLNGAILGMRREEIARKFDEIVEFAEVERFIDTPVKRYSSGMYLRLAFSVAAHLEPEILIVDEVLSVGDLAFQEKCLGRMEAVAGEGRTVLFVSHNLTAVSKLCNRAMLLSHGRKVIEGPTHDVIEAYTASVTNDSATDLQERTDRLGNGRLRFTEVRFESPAGEAIQPTTGIDLDIVMRYRAESGRPLRNVNFAVTVATVLGDLMLHLYSVTSGSSIEFAPADGEVRCHLPRCPLPAGRYVLNLWADAGREQLDWVQRACDLTVADGDFFRSGQAAMESHRTVLVDHSWTVRPAAESPAGVSVS
jgi:lipopolysaccharide transport system ATP-binding protein